MIKEIIATGKDVAEAQANARQLLGANELDDVKFEIIYLGRKGFMGFGSKPAQVKAYIELPDKEEKRRRSDRRKDRGDRPERRATEVKEEVKEVKSSDESDLEQTAETPKPKKKKHKKNHQGAQRENSSESKPKSQVIPECELKLERRDVAEGEDMSYDFIRTVILDIGLNEVEGHILALLNLLQGKVKLGFGNSLSLRLVVLLLFFSLLIVLLSGSVVLSLLSGSVRLVLLALFVAVLSFNRIGNFNKCLNLSGFYAYYSENSFASCVDNLKIYVIERACAESRSRVFFSLDNILTAGNYFLYHTV